MSAVVDHVSNNRGKYAGMSAALVTACVMFIAPWEGTSTKPYRDSVGVLTICDGATAADGVDFSKVYTKADCQRMLGKDLPKYDAPLQRCIKPEVFNSLPIPRHVALISLSYNIGGAAVCKSSIVTFLNEGEVQAACDAFLRYNHAGGRVLEGLTNRRIAERKLCLGED